MANERPEQPVPDAPATRPKSSSRVEELDGLRGVLALWVAVSHILLWCGFAELPLGARLGRIWHSIIYSLAAVETFYILSGFAISFLLHARRQTYAGFITGRFFRIYPVYLICLGLGLATMQLTVGIVETATWRDTGYFQAVNALSVSERANPVAHVAGHLSLLNGLIPRQVLPGSAATLLVPAWSISVEWQYYLLAPLIALLVRSGTGLLLLAGLAWLGIRYGGPWNNPLPAFLPPMLPFFLIGIASYHLYEAFCGSGAPRSSRYAVFVAAAVGAAVVFKWHSAALAIWAVAFGCLFVAGDGTLVRVLRGLRRGLGHRWVEQLGKISYPLYLVHWPLIIICLTVLLSWKPRIASHEAALWLLCGGLPLIVGAAFLLHRFVEAPAMRLGRRLADRIGKTPSIDLLPPKEAKPGTLSLMPPGT